MEKKNAHTYHPPEGLPVPDRITVALVGGPWDGRLVDLEARALHLPLHVATGVGVCAIPPDDAILEPPAILQTTYRFTGSIDDHGVRRFSCLPDGW